MKIFINSVPYRVSFEHNNFTNSSKTSKEQSFTVCTIMFDETEEVLCKERALLSLKEKNYNKEKGRKISLKKCLSNCSFFNKEERKLFWKTYFNRKKD